MNNKDLKENTVFNDMEILEIFIDLLYRNLDSDTRLRSSFESINREVSDFFGMPPKSYIGQLLYIISDVDQIRRSFVDHIEFYYREMNRKVKRVVGVSLAIEIVQNVHFLEEFDVVMIENIEEFYNSTDAIQKKLARILESYLETGGKLLVTGCEFDNSNDALSKIFDSRNFRFTYRRSVEHWYPQNPNFEDSGMVRMSDSLLHSFGNLCIITDSQNSKFGNSRPQAKYSQWEKIFENQSLKLQWMAKLTGNSDDNWNSEVIRGHEDKILMLVKEFIDCTKNI